MVRSIPNTPANCWLLLAAQRLWQCVFLETAGQLRGTRLSRPNDGSAVSPNEWLRFSLPTSPNPNVNFTVGKCIVIIINAYLYVNKSIDGHEYYQSKTLRYACTLLAAEHQWNIQQPIIQPCWMQQSTKTRTDGNADQDDVLSGKWFLLI